SCASPPSASPCCWWSTTCASSWDSRTMSSSWITARRSPRARLNQCVATRASSPPISARRLPRVLLELDHIISGYGRSPVLHEVSLAVAAGEIVALIGANGAGKSTLLNTIVGLVAASSGAIRFDGAPITHLPTPTIVRTGIAQVPELRQLFGAMS